MSEVEFVRKLRAEFVRLLTVDSETTDARRREYNQAIFMPAEDMGGIAIWTRTDLSMVMEKFDKASVIVRGRR